MRNLIMFWTVLLLIVIPMFIGARLKPTVAVSVPRQATNTAVPHIGSIQVLNGCGVEGAALRIADFLRMKKFDVKDIGNSPAWNYPNTMVISRTEDMTLAQEIEKILKTDRLVLIRTSEQLYDVTVVVGPDFEEKIK